jgi:hypothetical protein
MKKLLFTLLIAPLLLLFSSCQKEEVFNQTIFKTTLSGANEVPARSTNGFGDVIGYYDNVKKELVLRVNYYNLRAPLTAWHIHKAAPGVNGGVLFNFGTPQETGNFITIPALTADQETDLMNGNYYVNLHTSVYPGGEIRGQLIKQ